MNLFSLTRLGGFLPRYRGRHPTQRFRQRAQIFCEGHDPRFYRFPPRSDRCAPEGTIEPGPEDRRFQRRSLDRLQFQLRVEFSPLVPQREPEALLLLPSTLQAVPVLSLAARIPVLQVLRRVPPIEQIPASLLLR